MFKVRDKIVCVNGKMVGYTHSLSVNEIYVVLANYVQSEQDHIAYFVENDNGNRGWYYADRFISLKEYRRKKLDKINEI